MASFLLIAVLLFDFSEEIKGSIWATLLLNAQDLGVAFGHLVQFYIRNISNSLLSAS